MGTFIDYVLDLETSGKRGWHGVRDKFNPPRITQFGLIQIDPSDPFKYKTVIGKGPGGGWTNVISELIEKHKPASEMNLTPAFWRELSIYDPSVNQKGSVLNDQVRAHVREYLALKKTGQTGEMKSATDYINRLRSEVQVQIDKGNTVRLHAYNKGFDVNQMLNEMHRADPKQGRSFMNWLEKNVTSGRVQLKGVEENIHRGMFNTMMADADVMPRFVSSKYFERARAAGLKTVGIEATTPHHALRELIDNIKTLGGNGSAAKQALQGLPAELRAQMASVKSYEDFTRFTKWLEQNPNTSETLMTHLNKQVSAKHGVEMAKHVREPGFNYVMGWRQELMAKGFGMKQVAHRAVDDAMTSWGIHMYTQNRQVADGVGRYVMTNQAFLAEEAATKFMKFSQEAAGAVRPQNIMHLMQQAHRSRIAPPAALSRLARSPNTLPILAAAGGLLAANQIAKNSSPPPIIAAMKEQMEGQIEGLRSATGQWDIFGGINPSRPGVGAFGSGREAQWDGGSYKGVNIHPDIAHLSQMWAMHPQWQYQEQMMGMGIKKYGPTRDETANRRIDLADYIYEVKDADTIQLRKAWLSQDLPVLGPAMGLIQKTLMNAAQTLTGENFGFSVRIDNIDAPETAHGSKMYLPGAQPGAKEATSKMAELMRGGFVRRVLAGGRATHLHITGKGKYGRITGTPYAGGRDIAGELVQSGGAISTAIYSHQYMAQEKSAMSAGRGMWEYPEYAAVPEARKRGIDPRLSPLKRYSQLSRSLDAAAMYSLMAYARNPQMHAVRDQSAQNLYVRGY